MNNPLEHNAMFVTPENMEDLMQYCEKFTAGERAAAFVCAGMALNLAHKMVEEALKEESK